MHDINSKSRVESLSPKQAPHYHAPLGLSDKGHAIKGLVLPFDILNGLVLCYYYHPSPMDMV